MDSSSPPERRTIYLAGPDCFRSDAFEHYEKMKQLAQAKGFHAISPLDSEVDIEARDIMETIFKINMEDIDVADVVVANCEAFRGACVDDGTAFELGVACAKGKPLVLYTPTAATPLWERLAADFKDESRAAYFQQEKYPARRIFPARRSQGL